MKCPACGHDASRVLESRSIENNEVTKRRRECINCSFRFTTYEKVDAVPIVVVKKDGSRELFSKEKIIRVLDLACTKRPVSFEQLEAIADEVEAKINEEGLTEVPSSFIGEMVVEKLMVLDEIAYVRFASIYRQFKDVNSFMEEIQNLLKRK